PVTATRTLAETVPSSCRTRVGSAVALPMMTVWMSRMAVSFLKAGRSRRRHRADAPQRPGLMAAVPGNGRLCGRGRSVEERFIRGGTGPRRLRAARGRFGADARGGFGPDARGGCVPDDAGPGRPRTASASRTSGHRGPRPAPGQRDGRDAGDMPWRYR